MNNENTLNKQSRPVEAIGFILQHHNRKLAGYGIECGAANGYVAVPPSNFFYGLDYDDEVLAEIDVHGGLTYSSSADVFKANCVLNDAKPCYITAADTREIPDDWWVIGFDTCHAGDNSTNWPVERVMSETWHLYYQLLKSNDDGTEQ